MSGNLYFRSYPGQRPYFTITFIFFVALLYFPFAFTLTVITAVPLFFPFILPLVETVATFLLFDLYEIFPLLLRVTFSCTVFPFLTFTVFLAVSLGETFFATEVDFLYYHRRRCCCRYYYHCYYRL